jgi:hypothetical protein
LLLTLRLFYPFSHLLFRGERRLNGFGEKEAVMLLDCRWNNDHVVPVLVLVGVLLRFVAASRPLVAEALGNALATPEPYSAASWLIRQPLVARRHIYRFSLSLQPIAASFPVAAFAPPLGSHFARRSVQQTSPGRNETVPEPP